MVAKATFRPRGLSQSRPSGEFFVPGFDLYEKLPYKTEFPTEALDFREFYLFFKKVKLSRWYTDSDILDLFVRYDRKNCGILSPIQYGSIINEVVQKFGSCQRPYPDSFLWELDGIAYYRQWLHYTLEDFNFSLSAKLMQFFSMSLIIVSTICFILESIENLQGRLEFFYIECVISIYFTIEYLVRLACCKSRRVFITNWLNIIDLISFLPFFVELSGVVQDLRGVRVVRTIRVIRMVRILKLGFFAHYMLIFSEALEYAKHSFGMLGILFLFPLVIFACLTFSVEVGFGTKLISIFDAMYFVVATMTTLGYGDQYPITATGKVIVCFTVLTGIIYITLAIQMIGNCFDKAYGNYLIRFADRKRSAALRLGQVVGNNRRSSWHSIFAASELSLTSSSRERRSTYKATLPNSGFEQMQLRVPALKKFSVDCSPDSNAKSEEST